MRLFFSAQGLKPRLFKGICGTAEAVPFPKHFGNSNLGASPNRLSRRLATVFALFVFCFSAAAWADTERGIMVRDAQLFVSPDPNSQKLNKVGRGREVAIIEKSHDFIKVLANIEGSDEAMNSDRIEGLSVTGWMLDKGVVRASTPNGDKVLFGEAVDSEAEASRRQGRRGAAHDAMRLYYRTAEYFPKSPLAGEAMWRSADIRWQLDKAGVQSRPSAKEREAYLRGQIDENYMKEVQKKFPGTKWADLAAYNRLDNKVCGEWQGLPKCPESESEMFEKYVKEHPQSPKAAEALYEAAWRQGALVDIYKTRDEKGKAEIAKQKSLGLCQTIIIQYAQQTSGDWPERAQRLQYLLKQGVPIYGTLID